MVSVARCLPGTTTFVVGESSKGPDGSGISLEQVALYDMSQVIGGGVPVAPLSRFVEHTDMVTCMAPVAEMGGVFLSGELHCMCIARGRGGASSMARGLGVRA
jgi:hypothetical protein